MTVDRDRAPGFLALTCVGFVATMAAPAGAQEQQPTTLKGVTVTDSAVVDPYKAEPESPKFTAPLLDTPRQVTIIPQAVIDQSASFSLSDTLRMVPGITLGSGEGGNPAGDRPFIRGFDAQSDTFVDGLRDAGSQSRETFNLEQVEVMKGPNSTFSGRGSSGGSINLVTKKPRSDAFVTATGSLGTDEFMRATVDINQPLSDVAAVRLNAMWHDQDIPGRDAVYSKRWGVAPSVAFGLDTPTRAVLSYYHVRTDDMPDYGLPYTSPGGRRTVADVDPDNFYGLNNRDFRDITADSATAQFEHDLSSDMTIRNIARWVRTSNDYVVTNPDDSAGNVARGVVWRNIKSRDSVYDGLINQTDLRGDVTAGGMKHSFVVGFEFGKEQTRNDPYALDTASAGSRTCGAAAPAFICTSLANPNPNDPWAGSVSKSGAFTKTRASTLAAYALDTISLTDALLLNVGIRYDDFSVKQLARTAAGVMTDLRNDADFVSWQAGLTFKPTESSSLYVSYATSANPSGTDVGDGAQALSAANDSLNPERNRNWEAGAKWELFDSALMLSAAIFRNEKTNARVAGGLAGEQILVGEQRVDGFEVGVTGNAGPLSVFGGYSYLDATVLDDGPAAFNDGNRFPNVPKHSFSLFSTLEVARGASIGGGAFYVSKRYGDPANLITIPSYWRFDATASLRVNANVDLRLNVLNLTDKRYFERPYTNHMTTVAAGRSALVTATLRL